MSNTEQILSAGIGATIGFFVGGPAGAFAGFQYGLLAGSILFPGQLPGVEGPRLEDFERAEADPGAAVWKCYGRVAVPGFRMYLGPVSEIASTEEVGGKGAPTQDVTTYTYTQTLALGLCEGPIQGVVRVWENGKLVYDVREQQVGETDEAYTERITTSLEYEATFVLYLGDEDQLPDPTMELELGAGNVPAHRGLAYMVYPDRQLKPDQANRHPVFKVEVAPPDPIVLPLLLAMGSKVGPTTNFMAYSLDGGETWNECVVPVAGQWFGAAYSPSLGYAIAVSSTGQVIKSLDGVTWEAMPGEDLTNGNWQAGCVRNADDSLFVVVGLGGTSGLRAATSPDGVTWTLRSTPTVGGATSWGIMRMHESGAIFAASFAGGIKNLIRSDDGGITWAHVATAFSSVQNVTDFAFREGTDYIHCVGMNNTGAPSSFISSDLGVTSWQSVAFNSGSTPTGQAVILDPDSGFVYAATLSQGIWRIPAGETNVTNDKWVQVYAAGNIGAASHGGWISQLQRGFFCTPSGGGFAVHRLVDGAWSTDSYPSLLPATARVRVAFLPFPVGG